MAKPNPYQEGLDSLARCVRGVRKKCGLSQEALAEKAGLDVRHVQKVEAAEVNATMRTLARLASALGVPLKKLFD